MVSAPSKQSVSVTSDRDEPGRVSAHEAQDLSARKSAGAREA